MPIEVAPEPDYGFNSRTREGCDPSIFVIPLQRSLKFQFTHPGGVRLAWSLSYPAQMRFNSRTREGCDSMEDGFPLLTTKFQFTHPGGVRLFRSVLDFSLNNVSIHAPGRGATASRFRVASIRSSFNSRTREGCDKIISDALPSFLRFNSRTREGCDVIDEEIRVIRYTFQFTHPGGVRRSGM